MATAELHAQWARTESYLRDARANISQIAEAEFSDLLSDAEEFIDHNELGLALDALLNVAEESSWESMRVFELLALAAASMSLGDVQRKLDALISKMSGSQYETRLPNLR